MHSPPRPCPLVLFLATGRKLDLLCGRLRARVQQPGPPGKLVRGRGKVHVVLFRFRRSDGRRTRYLARCPEANLGASMVALFYRETAPAEPTSTIRMLLIAHALTHLALRATKNTSLYSRRCRAPVFFFCVHVDA